MTSITWCLELASMWRPCCPFNRDSSNVNHKCFEITVLSPSIKCGLESFKHHWVRQFKVPFQKYLSVANQSSGHRRPPSAVKTPYLFFKRSTSLNGYAKSYISSTHSEMFLLHHLNGRQRQTRIAASRTPVLGLLKLELVPYLRRSSSWHARGGQTSVSPAICTCTSSGYSSGSLWLTQGSWSAAGYSIRAWCDGNVI